VNLGWLTYLFAGSVFVAIGLVALTVMWPRSSAYHRMKQISRYAVGKPKPTLAVVIASPGLLARISQKLNAVILRPGWPGERLATRLARAGIRTAPNEWILLRVGAAALAGLPLAILAGWLGCLMGLALGWLLALLYQTARVDRWSGQFADQLPDALQLVIGSLRSGFSLQHSLDSLVRESVDPIAAEFGRAMAEHRLGVDVSDALERVAQRTRSDDLEWTVMAVRIQREVGGNLAEVLQTTVDTMRERGRLRRHVRSLSAEGRLSAMVLIALPILLALFMFFYRRDYLAPLFTDPFGLTMLVGGGLLLVTGIIWMLRVIKVEA
jgi:Flp pilus assembly protein TadB